MKLRQLPFRVAAITAWSGLVLCAVSAVRAEEESSSAATLNDLTRPTNRIEAGVRYVSDDSFKFGEYNGLGHEGPYGIGNIDLAGGGRYDSDDTTRWRVVGTNLGLQTRNVFAEYGHQGLFRLSFGYDELLRNRSDSYATPYLGAGTSVLSLPANWQVPVVPVVDPAAADARGLSARVAQSNALVGGVLTAPSAADVATSAAIQGADLPAFHHVDLWTKRTKYDGAFVFDFNPEWEFNTSFRHEQKDGLKPMGSITKSANDGVSTVIPDLIDQTTDQVNASVTYTGGKGYLQAAYYGSFFHNSVPSMSWQNWSDPTASATMSSAPSNEFNQFNLTGGYNFTPTTKLVVNGSYGRNTQNATFLQDSGTPLVPEASLHGLVETTMAGFKLTTRPLHDLSVNLGYKYDDRDNQTPVRTFGFYDANDPASGVNIDPAFAAALHVAPGLLSDNVNVNANRPYSKTMHQANLEADYRLWKRNWLKLGYDWQEIDRSCGGTWVSCADADKSTEHAGRIEWRSQVTQDLSGRLGYTYSQRRVDYNENAFLALVPMAGVSPTGAPLLPDGTPATAYNTMRYYGLNGYGLSLGANPAPAAGSALEFFFANNNALDEALYQNMNRISEILRMRRFNMADRNRHKLRASGDWQATEAFSVQTSFDFDQDDYTNSLFGLKDARNWAFNLDGSYQFNERFVANLFYTHEDQRSRSAGRDVNVPNDPTITDVNGFTAVSGGCMTSVADVNTNAKIDPCQNWTTDMHDETNTVGLSARSKGLWSPKLDLLGEATYTWARTNIGVRGGDYVDNPLAVGGAPATTVGSYYIPAADLPTVTTNTLSVVVSGQYRIDKSSSIRAMYSYEHLKSSDWRYAGMQFGSLFEVLPSSERPDSYDLHSFGISYIYSFNL